jgi:hypothetical protein
MPKSKPKWKLVTEYPITEYQCGVRAGEKVRLRQELVVRDTRGKPSRVHHVGEIWTVLSGSVEPPVVVLLRQPDGERHTWDDGDIFWTWFERVDDNAA